MNEVGREAESVLLTGVKSGAGVPGSVANAGLKVAADKPPKLNRPAKFNSKIASGVLTNAMSPPNLKL